jgi:guanylate kinase
MAAPSGAGKTSLVQALVNSLENIEVSVSHTTRPKRTHKEEGLHYFFVSQAEFEDMVTKDIFLEHAQVYGAYYGTSREWVLSKLRTGIDIILEIDWQGACQVKRHIPESTGIFVLPPSLDILSERLHARDQDSEQVIAQRMALARQEIRHCMDFDYWIVNDEFEKSLHQLSSIVTSMRLTKKQQMCRHRNLLAALGI